MNKHEAVNNDIAVIGIALRFPDANNPTELWNNLMSGKESIRRFQDQDLANAGIKSSSINRPNFQKASGIIEDIDKFDAEFFNYSAAEASLVDPQNRLFLECAFEALESSGYSPEKFKGDIGVFAGSFIPNYLRKHLADIASKESENDDEFYTLFRALSDYLSTNTAYRLNLTGPTISVQSWCTTALASVYSACINLQTRECDIALAGGVHLRLPQEGYFRFKGSSESEDGHTRFLDQDASGSVPGSGLGVIVLKRLNEAIRDNDYIWSVIKGFSMVNDGSHHEKLSYHTTSIAGQTKAIEKAIRKAGVEIESIRYVELHGNATQLGDRKEFTALKKVFQARTTKKNFCSIGSIAPNIGNLGNVAGFAALVKSILTLKNRTIPALINLQTLNPSLKINDSPFFVHKTPHELNRGTFPLRAGVNSYGIGGTYMFFVLEEPPSQARVAVFTKPIELLTISAKSPEALAKIKGNLFQFLNENDSTHIPNLCYTINIGRKDFPFKQYFLFNNRTDAVALLRENDPGKIINAHHLTSEITYTFNCFSKNDPQIVCKFYNSFLFFQRKFDECNECVRTILGTNLKQLFFENIQGQSASTLHQLLFNFCINYAFYNFLKHLGLSFSTVESESNDLGPSTLQGDTAIPDTVSHIIHFAKCLEEKGLNTQWCSSQKPCLTIKSNWNRAVNKNEKDRNFTYYYSFITDDHEEKRSQNAFTEIVSLLWTTGVKIDWDVFYFEENRRRVPLPTYPLNRKRYWIEEIPSALPELDIKEDVILNAQQRKEFTHEDVIGLFTNMFRKLLGTQSVALTDNFFNLGGNSLIATSMLNQLENVHGIRLTFKEIFDHPSISQLSEYVHLKMKSIEKSKHHLKPIEHDLFRNLQTHEKQSYIKRQIVHAIATLLNIEKKDVCEDVLIKHWDKLLPEVALIAKRDFGLTLYTHELERSKDPDKIAQLILHELEIQSRPSETNVDFTGYLSSWIPPVRILKTGDQQKIAKTVFLLSGQRCGSTLLRLILNTHPRLFNTPETGLLMFNDMQEWKNGYKSSPIAQEGIPLLFKEIDGVSHGEARRLVANLVAENRNTFEVYKYIHAQIGSKILVDKCPDYAYKKEILQKAEMLFDKPKYIFLARHPYSVIESFARNRFNKVREDGDYNPYLLGEKMWTTVYSNLITFFRDIDPERYFFIRYEDLVNNPEQHLKNLCAFLAIDFIPAMLNPYEGAGSVIGSGDPNIYSHNQIEKELGNVWKDIQLPITLSEDTKITANELGYKLNENASENRLNPDILTADKADDLSEEELNALLRNLNLGNNKNDQ